jgi:2-polyprenyl-3-methyl-5-hydroxy-6-metoxy-1,4-benzoquinol methylase
MSSDLQNYNQKSSVYYDSSRNEIFEILPKNISSLLDIGCGNGSFGAKVKSELKIEVWGVELFSDAALKAKTKLDKVFNCSAEDAVSKIQKKFDCITFNDVLEHLVDPYKTLSEAKKLLTDKGIILFSVPNIRKINYMYDLVFRKDWRYEDSGVMDKTHLRFFTKKSVMRMIEDLDLEVINIKMLNRDNSFKSNLINLLSLGFFEDAMYLQILAVVRPK